MPVPAPEPVYEVIYLIQPAVAQQLAISAATAAGAPLPHRNEHLDVLKLKNVTNCTQSSNLIPTMQKYVEP